jgi:hypothetical protein
MSRVIRALVTAVGVCACGAFATAPMQEAYAQTKTKQARAKKKVVRQVPAARSTTQQAPPAQARTPAYDPTDRVGGSGGGSGY